MARTRVGKLRCKDTSGHCKLKSSSLKSRSRKVSKDCHTKTEVSKASVKKDWEDATCSVCLERPHNAVLLLCSSYDKGCRPYMCATSRRFSNCLEQYKKAYTKVTAVEGPNLMTRSADELLCNEKMEIPQLLCPLCRGQLKGWTVVEPARKYLNAKKRMCMQEKCSFTGTYKKLRRHVREKHPLVRPRDVDPALEAKWKKFEQERERNDVISTIMSSTPGAVVLGDYVIEPGHHAMYDDYDSDESLDDDDDGFFRLESFDRGHGNNFRFRNGYRLDLPSLDEFNFGVRRRRVAPARLFVRGFRRPFESRASSRGRS